MDIQNEFDSFLTYFVLFSYLDHQCISFIRRCKQLTLVHSSQTRHCFYGPRKSPMLSAEESCFYSSNLKLAYFDKFERLEKLELCGYSVASCSHEMPLIKSFVFNSNFDPRSIINCETLNQFKMLTELSLDFNNVIKLDTDPKIFDKLINIEKLSIFKIDIFNYKSNSNGFFNRLNKLRDLTIEHCHISDLQVNFFNGIENLQLICIESSFIGRVQSKAFGNLSQLRKFVFNKNYSHYIAPFAFCGG